MPRLLIDLVGKRFGRLLVEARVGREGTPHWRCRCDCGKESIVAGGNLRNGHTTSCGCLRAQAAGTAAVRHGMTRTPTWSSWNSMRDRCLSATNKDFHNYGGRGITICSRWESFENFLADMGEKPEGMSLDRIDVNGNYEPGNCRWADYSTQNRNQRRHLDPEVKSAYLAEHAPRYATPEYRAACSAAAKRRYAKARSADI
jgi:hypothetical protein